MITSLVAKQAKGKKLKDVYFATAAQARADAAVLGKDHVLNGTVGAMLDENGDLVFLSTVEKEYLSLPSVEHIGYAPIEGLPEFLEAAEEACFSQSRPEGHIRSIATAGGTGGIHHLVHNYTQPGDEVLTSDWYWGAYGCICTDNGRKLGTYTLFDDNNNFNHQSLQEEVNRIAEKQENVLILFNTPGNNPTGYSIEGDDWDKIIDFLKGIIVKGKNKVIIGVDVAYLDYSGEKEEIRSVFKKFGNLPKEILTVICYSLSKGFTMYGQRVGAMIGISSELEVAEEFRDVNKSTSRATWSNICRPAMRTMANIMNDKEKFTAYEAERNTYNILIQERANIFKEEAAACGLPMLPYRGGFFITIPTEGSAEICEELKKDHVYVIPLAKGIRIAACSIPKAQMKGLAKAMYTVMKHLGRL